MRVAGTSGFVHAGSGGDGGRGSCEALRCMVPYVMMQAALWRLRVEAKS